MGVHLRSAPKGFEKRGLRDKRFSARISGTEQEDIELLRGILQNSTAFWGEVSQVDAIAWAVRKTLEAIERGGLRPNKQ